MNNDNKYNEYDNTSSSNMYYQYNNTLNSMQAKKKNSSVKRTMIIAVVLCSVFSLILGLTGGFVASRYYLQTADITDIAGNSETPSLEAETVETSDNTDSIYTTSDIGKSYDTVADIYAATVDAVVGIEVEMEVTSGWSTYTSTASGSGVIISSDGYIVTNNHVINGASSIVVYLNNGESYTAELVGLDVQLDIALLKIKATGLSFMEIGDSDTVVVGDLVLVIGNPLGYLNESLTVGYISGLEREITLENEAMVLLQTDASVNPGNSGGALINTKGELIGIINAKSYGEEIEGIGFAIPINDVKDILDDIVAYGYVKGRPYLGVSLGDITADQISWYNMMYDMELTDAGTYIGVVGEGSAAETAGLKAWDRVVSFNGTEVTGGAQLKSLVDECEVGQSVEIVIVRAGTTMTLSIIMGEEIPDTAD
ncbi:MAG: trypsin-like peptidase domain-containing protein [Clostridia bacterium]